MKGAGLVTIVLLLFGSVVAGVNGCSEESRYPVLSAIFEGVPKPGEKRERKMVEHHVRRPPPPIPTPTPKPVEVAAVVEKPPQGREWLAKLIPKLPKDKSGQPDMVRALKEKLIAPRPGIAEKAKDQPVFNLDVALVPKGQPAMKALFSHKAHTQWLGCPNCHPGIFQMKKGGDPMTMAALYAGKYCARCHGKVAFGIPTGCARCHPALGGGK